jgi:hypothetical protein
MSSTKIGKFEWKANSSIEFTGEKFIGTAESSQEFYEEIRMQVANEFSSDGLKYLFRNWPLVDGTEDTPNVGSEYTEKVLPSRSRDDQESQTPSLDFSSSCQRGNPIWGWTSYVIGTACVELTDHSDIEMRNQQVRASKNGCMRIISERSDPSLNLKYQSFK